MSAADSRLDALLEDFAGLADADRARVIAAAAAKRLPDLALAELFDVTATEAELDQLAALIEAVAS